MELIKLFRASKSYIVVGDVVGSVAIDGFKQGSERRFPLGVHFELIGGKLTKTGVSFYKTSGISAPVKIANDYRLDKGLLKCLPLLANQSGVFQCGTAFPAHTVMFMLGGKSKRAKLICYASNRWYELNLLPNDVLIFFRPLEVGVSNLISEDNIRNNNLHSDAITRRMGKKTAGAEVRERMGW